MDESAVFDDEWADDELLAECAKAESHLVDTQTSETRIPPDHVETLRQHFGHSQFKDLQWKIVRSVLVDKRDQCVVMATGYGKSLCYQYPPVYLGQTSLVVSPLIALMEDQVLALAAANIPATYLGSSQVDKAKIYDDIKAKKFRVVYVTPEFVDHCGDLLQSLFPPEALCLIAIDEAHCVSQWGHDFRSSYRHLNRLRRIFPQTPTLALTATATDNVIQDICQALNLKDCQIVKTSFDRPNLYIEIRPKTDVWNDLNMITHYDESTSKRIIKGSTIIYCPTKKEVDHVADILSSHGLKIRSYHAGKSYPQREISHKEFIRDQCDAIVCSVAFGMGINKPDVRRVIHYGAPKDMESYYQEMGRAGRDGQPATVMVFYTLRDFVTHRHLLGDIKNEVWRQHRLDMVHQMEVFLGKKKSCRRSDILAHFGETLDREGRTIKCCDNCTQSVLSTPRDGLTNRDTEDEEVDFSPDARLMLEAVQQCGGIYGLGVPCSVLKGLSDKTVKEYLTRLPIFGQGKAKAKPYWMALARSLAAAGYVGQKTIEGGKYKYNTFHISAKGSSFLANPEAQFKQIPTKELRSHIEPKKTLNFKDALPVQPKNEWFPAKGASEADTSIFEDLYARLIQIRADVASKAGLAPYMVLAEETLKQLTIVRPSTVGGLEAMGVARAKVEKFGQEFVREVQRWCQKKGIEMDNKVEMESQVADVLNATQQVSYTLFKELGNLEAVAAQRGLKASTIATHMCEAIKAGLPVSVDKLGLDPEKKAKIESIIFNPPIESNILRLAPIKEECDLRDLNVGWEDVKITVALLCHDLEIKDNLVQWSEDRIRQFRTQQPDSSTLSGLSLASPIAKKRELPAWLGGNPAAHKPDLVKKLKKNSIFK